MDDRQHLPQPVRHRVRTRQLEHHLSSATESLGFRTLLASTTNPWMRGKTFELMHSRTGIASSSEIPGAGVQPSAQQRVVGRTGVRAASRRASTTARVAHGHFGESGMGNVISHVMTRTSSSFGLYNGVGVYLSYDGGASWSNFTNGRYRRELQLPRARSWHRDRRAERRFLEAAEHVQLHAVRLTDDQFELAERKPRLGRRLGPQHHVVADRTSRSPHRVPEDRRRSWQLVAEVSGSTNSYAWSLPTTRPMTRESASAMRGTTIPVDESDGVFTIAVSGAAPGSARSRLRHEAQGHLTTLVLTVENNGSGTLHVLDVTTSNLRYRRPHPR